MRDVELTREEIGETEAILRPFVRRTPCFEWGGSEVDKHFGGRTEVVLKLELFQQTGTFKIRGALSNILRLSPEEKRRGVTAVSAGNHAIAVASAAAMLGIGAKVVMLASANVVRVAAAKASGAQVLFAEDGPAAFELANRIAESEGRAFIHPFEGRNTALGTATLGAEFAEQAPRLDALILAVGGGGLAGGVSAAFKQLQPACRIYGVEPEGADTMHRSFAVGSPQRIDRVSTIADSLAPPMALPYSFSLCRANIDELVKVDDHQICRAMAVLFRDVKLAVEPAGAAALAALMGPLKDRLAGKRVGVLVCGSNIDAESFIRFVKQGEESFSS
jgi:threonine dehydratase